MNSSCKKRITYQHLTRTVALINSSRFLRGLSAFYKVYRVRGTRIRSSALYQIFVPWLIPGSVTNLYRDRCARWLRPGSSKVTNYCCHNACASIEPPALHKILPWWQKPRRASRPTALENLKVYSRNTAHGLRSTQQRLLMLTAGPLVHIGPAFRAYAPWWLNLFMT